MRLMRYLGWKLRCLTMVSQMVIGFFGVCNANCPQKKILLPGSGLGPRPVKDIKTEGTWTAIQVEFLNMRILDKWMLISIVFSGDGEVPAHDFPVDTFFFPLPSPPLGLSPTSQLWTLALGLFGDRFRWVVAHFSTDYIWLSPTF